MAHAIARSGSMSHVLTTCLTLCHFPRLENLKAPVSPFSFLLTNMALTADTAAVLHQTKQVKIHRTPGSARRVGRGRMLRRLGLGCASCLARQPPRLRPPFTSLRCHSTRSASSLLDVLIIQPKHARRRTSHLRRHEALSHASRRRHCFSRTATAALGPSMPLGLSFRGVTHSACTLHSLLPLISR